MLCYGTCCHFHALDKFNYFVGLSKWPYNLNGHQLRYIFVQHLSSTPVTWDWKFILVRTPHTKLPGLHSFQSVVYMRLLLLIPDNLGNAFRAVVLFWNGPHLMLIAAIEFSIRKIPCCNNCSLAFWANSPVWQNPLFFQDPPFLSGLIIQLNL